MFNKWLFTILAQAQGLASPAIIENIRQLIQEMVDKAEKTPNPWDDVICGLIQSLVGKPNDSWAEKDEEAARSTLRAEQSEH